MSFTYSKPELLLTTTAMLEGHEILEYKGLAVGEAIIGANIFRDLFAAVRDIAGGRAGACSTIRASSRLKRCRKRRKVWAPMRSSVSISIMRRSIRC